MSRKKPIDIDVYDNLQVQPDGIFESEVVPSGNGAVIKFFKRFIGSKVIVMVVDKMKDKKERMSKEDKMDIGDYTEIEYLHDKK